VVNTHVVSSVLHVVGSVVVRGVRSLLATAHLLTSLVAVEATLTESGVLSLLELLLHRESLQELGNLEVELITGGNVVPLRGVEVDLLESLETKLVLGLFVDDVTVLFQLVMADGELSVAYQTVVQLLEGLLSLVWCLEAHEGIGLFWLVDGEELDTLNFTEFLEDLSETFLRGVRVKVLDVEVASLLGVFVLDGLTKFLL